MRNLDPETAQRETPKWSQWGEFRTYGEAVMEKEFIQKEYIHYLVKIRKQEGMNGKYYVIQVKEKS